VVVGVKCELQIKSDPIILTYASSVFKELEYEATSAEKMKLQVCVEDMSYHFLCRVGNNILTTSN
jgi:hypothetical protein